MMKNKLLIPAILALSSFAISTSHADDDSILVEFKSLKPEAAMTVVMETLNACREMGYQVGVSVVDRMGVMQAAVKDQYAGPHTLETSRRKAWTAISFRTDTLALAVETQSGKESSGVRFISDALMAGGGVPILAAGSLIGGVGVSGAPNGRADHDCALAGIEAIMDDLEF